MPNSRPNQYLVVGSVWFLLESYFLGVLAIASFASETLCIHRFVDFCCNRMSIGWRCYVCCKQSSSVPTRESLQTKDINLRLRPSPASPFGSLFLQLRFHCLCFLAEYENEVEGWWVRVVFCATSMKAMPGNGARISLIHKTLYLSSKVCFFPSSSSHPSLWRRRIFFIFGH